MSSRFIHLHTHSHYSLLQALPKIGDLIEAAKKNGMEALALTDNGNMYGAIEFYKAAKAADIKPIIGVDFYMSLRSRHEKEAGIDNRRTRLILLAKNEKGYKNLIKLVTAGQLEGFYYKPRIDYEVLKNHSDGLIAISPSFSSDISQAIKSGDDTRARDKVDYFRQVFGDENFFIEITRHQELAGHDELMEKLVAFAKSVNVEIVAAHDVYYIHSDDKKARETLLSIQSNGDLREQSENEDFSFISEKRALELFSDLPHAIDNTKKIAAMCNVELELGKWVFPKYIVESGHTYDHELERLVYEGIKKRSVIKTAEVEERIKYELGIIYKKGYSPYFLVVSDLLNFAHKNNILTTIRGSVAGSMVTYLAGITNVNPIEYKLPFERFLNPERPSAPDIDMDYADNRRDEVINYAKEKYGVNNVAQIGTFGTMMARGSVRDVARALNYPYITGDRISKMIPMGSQGFPMTIDKALEIVPELAKAYKDEAETKIIIDMAKKIEGCARHISVHAAGVVMSPIELSNFTPLQFDPKGEGKIITQYDMHSVEDAGLLKFDFLGIKNLSILADAVKLAKKLEGVQIDIENIRIDDKKTYEMLARGETIGLFQLNGAGMTRYLKELRPTSIHDINAMVALYRPGPMESIPQYIERKHNPLLVKYLDPRMKDILTESYGVITYQDDVMLIAINLAGYSWLEADKLRKAMGKKIPAEMEAQKEKLVSGLISNGMTAEKAQGLWRLIEPFAAYGFNKAHAASYGRVAYQTSYMKANFPAIYMTAVLTADSGDVEKIAEIIAECKRMNIPVLPPDIQESFGGFTVVKGNTGEGDKIRFGLTTIKNFGEGIGKIIIDDRQKNGKFKSLKNFLDRIRDRNLNKKSLEALIKSGAMDSLGARGVMLANLDSLLAYNKEHADKNSDQDSLFGTSFGDEASLHMPLPDSTTDSEKLMWEKELLGLYLSGHPLDKFKEKLFGKMTIGKIKDDLKPGMTAIAAGLIEETKPIFTKKGDHMAFLRVADYTGAIEVVAFPEIYSEYKNIFETDRCVAIKGKISNRNGTISIIAEKAKEL